MKLLFLLLSIITSIAAVAQPAAERLDEQIDDVTYSWDLEADKLATYDGLLYVCSNQEYRTKVISLLNEIHHLDSVLYGVLVKLEKKSKDKEISRTLKDIKKFEMEYGTKNFIHFMGDECHAAGEIEKDAENTKNQVGINSYSGQVYVLETELFKYVKHVTQRVDKIRLHVHHLSTHYN